MCCGIMPAVRIKASRANKSCSSTGEKGAPLQLTMCHLGAGLQVFGDGAVRTGSNLSLLNPLSPVWRRIMAARWARSL